MLAVLNTSVTYYFIEIFTMKNVMYVEYCTLYYIDDLFN